MAKIKAFLCKIYKKVIERQIMLDIVIIGSGPAGLSAAIYGSRSGLDVLVIEKISPELDRLQKLTALIII